MLELKMPPKETLVRILWFYCQTSDLRSVQSFPNLLRAADSLCFWLSPGSYFWCNLASVDPGDAVASPSRAWPTCQKCCPQLEKDETGRGGRGWGTWGGLRWSTNMAKYLQQPGPHLIWETKWKMMLARRPATKSSRAMSSGLRACPTN